MEQYKKILVAVELIDKTDMLVLQRAQHIAKQNNAQIYLVHAIEHIGGYSMYDISIELEQVLVENATRNMDALGEQFGINKQQIVKSGSAKFVALEAAEDIGIDLIIVGSHGRHGIRALLGSTANAILHGALCDVLAVRITE